MCSDPPEPAAVSELPAMGAAAAVGADTISYARAADLSAVRAFVRSRALALGLGENRADLLTLAVSELTTNTLLYTHDGGRVRMWAEAGQLVCDVIDQGPQRTLGREMPPADAIRGRGLPIVERVTDEVSTSTSAEGTTARVRLNL
jgi:serine/threonine-protein kinase RsbW